jgi:hypothetical protein
MGMLIEPYLHHLGKDFFPSLRAVFAKQSHVYLLDWRTPTSIIPQIACKDRKCAEYADFYKNSNGEICGKKNMLYNTPGHMHSLTPQPEVP